MSLSQESKLCDCNCKTVHRSNCKYSDDDIFVDGFDIKEEDVVLKQEQNSELQWKGKVEIEHDTEYYAPLTIKVEKIEAQCLDDGPKCDFIGVGNIDEVNHDRTGDFERVAAEQIIDEKIESVLNKSEIIIEDFKIETLDDSCTGLITHDVDLKDVFVKNQEGTPLKHNADYFYNFNTYRYGTEWKVDIPQHIQSKPTGEKRFKCSQGDFTAAHKHSLVSHMKTEHSKKIPFKCDQCDYRNVRKFQLALHITARHTKERPFKCDQCDFCTARKFTLTQHITARHAKERPYKCDQCDYCSVRKSQLTQHVTARHIQERPFKCDQCDYCTVRKALLTRHKMALHTKERPCKCDQCDYCAVEKTELTRHIKARHTKARPHKCDQCDYCTVRKSRLRQHIMARHTKERPYKCDQCDYCTVTNSQLRQHIDRRH